MPWKERSVMDERMRFVIRLKDGETMASLCREFGISRKTGFKIFERYQQCGLEGLSDRARRPFRYANQLPESVEAAIVSAKREKPHWGARKIGERLLRRLPCRQDSCRLYHSRRARSPRVGPAYGSAPQLSRRDALVRGTASQRSLVHRLQGPVSTER
jgi:hypothetical protein